MRHQMVPQTLIIRTADGSPPTLKGLAAPYYNGAPGTEFGVGVMRERFAPGAFDGILGSNAEVLVLDAHQKTVPLARRSAGTLRLSDSPAGLMAEFDVPETTAGQDILTNVRNGNIQGLSVGFLPARGGVQQREEGQQLVYTITKVQTLGEISPTALPAYEGTTLSERSRLDFAAYARERLISICLGEDR